jgi:hypothetical protein
VGFNSLCLWWARNAGLPFGARLVVEGLVGLVAARIALAVADLWRGGAAERVLNRPAPAATRSWIVLSLLGGGLLAALFGRAPLLDHLAHAAHGPSFELPGLGEALRFLVTSPTALLFFALALWVRRRARKGELWPRLASASEKQTPALVLERCIQRAARAAHTVVEAGALTGALTAIARGIAGAAQLAHHWIEGEFLEEAARQIARTTIDGSRLTHRWIEGSSSVGPPDSDQETEAESRQTVSLSPDAVGLEGLMGRVVHAVLASSRWLQRRHTGRLRRNLIWVAASLALAILALILYVW